LFTLYITIIAFIIYWVVYYQIGYLKSDTQRVDQEIARIEAVKAKELEALLATLDDKVLWEWSKNSQIIGEGEAIYKANCVACHGTDLSATLEGVRLPGLPLNDGEWKYGQNPMDMFRLISAGSPQGESTNGARMEVWSNKLAPSAIARTVAYILRRNPLLEPPPDEEVGGGR
jgi:cytochrome c oxidase cbb3-type subunit 3